jgi:hypothetical protein
MTPASATSRCRTSCLLRKGKEARKKRLLIWAWGFDAITPHGPDYQKFFGSFFQKRTAFPLTYIIGQTALPGDRLAR